MLPINFEALKSLTNSPKIQLKAFHLVKYSDPKGLVVINLVLQYAFALEIQAEMLWWSFQSRFSFQEALLSLMPI